MGGWLAYELLVLAEHRLVLIINAH
jgi:hypothetical protein